MAWHLRRMVIPGGVAAAHSVKEVEKRICLEDFPGRCGLLLLGIEHGRTNQTRH